MTQLNFRAIRSSLMVNNGLTTGLALPITHYPVFFGVSGGLFNKKKPALVFYKMFFLAIFFVVWTPLARISDWRSWINQVGGSIGRRLGPAGLGCVTSRMSATPLLVMLGQPPGLAPGSSSGGTAVLGCCALAALHILYFITAKSRRRYCFQRIGEKH